MLIDFSVSNFRSFREQQVFSMVAAARLQKKNNVIIPKADGETLPGLLKVAAIYGPNASGKSNLILALEVVRTIAMADPTSAASKPIAVWPFRFDKDLLDKPSRFELHFLAGQCRYKFIFAANSERIVEEKLFSYPKGKESLLYERINTALGDEYNADGLDGGAVLQDAWKKLTGPRTFFIAQAVANSSEKMMQLRIPFEYIRGGISVIEDGMSRYSKSIRSLVKTIPDIGSGVASFLQELDVPVTSLKVQGPSSPTPDFLKIPDSTENSEILRGVLSDYASKNKDVLSTILTHKTALGEADFDYDEESEGTKELIGFWMPWNLLQFKDGVIKTLVVDELDSSLHPEIVENIVKRHLNSGTEGQLIFTTHDTHLMDTKLLRRDQFWVTERDINGATQLRSIHDFEGREGEDIEKRYFEGRYRGLPIFRRN